MKLTNNLLRRIIEEEVAKFGPMKEVEKVKAQEVAPEDLADSLENKVDYLKALKIKENRLRKALASIVEAKKKIINTL